MAKNTKRKGKRREKDLAPSSLHPLSTDDALRGAMQVPPPDTKPKRGKKKAKKKRKS